MKVRWTFRAQVRFHGNIAKRADISRALRFRKLYLRCKAMRLLTLLFRAPAHSDNEAFFSKSSCRAFPHLKFVFPQNLGCAVESHFRTARKLAFQNENNFHRLCRKIGILVILSTPQASPL